MLREWAKATDGTGNAVRVVLFDYQKAFDLINHRILARKVFQLCIPLSVKKWIVNFLMNREQRVKLTRDCYSEWRGVLAGVPQGTKLGPWLFIWMINDLRPHTIENWKYIDENYIQQWSIDNRLQVNSTKCKELRIHFGRDKLAFPSICVGMSMAVT